ncbi:hypothetical protein MK079_05555 [Candidatus Gracilibacteria bacterium]|nr:hypothetical protein [Candidatus Gracilibacteria bacterium]
MNYLNPFLTHIPLIGTQDRPGDTLGPITNTSYSTQILDMKNISGLSMTRCFVSFRGRYKLPMQHPVSIILSEMSCKYFPQKKYRQNISLNMLIEILSDIEQKVCQKNIKLSPDIHTDQHIYTLDVENVKDFYTDFAYILGQISHQFQSQYCYRFGIQYDTLQGLHKKYSQMLLSN